MPKFEIGETLISRGRLQKKVKELAFKIARDYRGKKLVLIGVLKGAMVFMSDLMREIAVPLEIDFIQAASYGTAQSSSGKVKVKKDIDLPLAGKQVLLIEDIIDCGYTLDYLLGFIKKKNPGSVKICVLLDKPSRRKVDVPLAYKGFEVPDKFIVGYGLDLAEKFRNLPYIAALRRV
jgi:hypoxanthine phosphoribosyltransferase